MKASDDDAASNPAYGLGPERRPAVADDGGSDRPRLSVCVACYNQAHFLDDAVRSIHDQMFDGAEIILVDDGSTDRTSEWSGRVDLRYVRQRNRGLSAARNAGLNIARADYVTFLDADDVYLPGAFEAAVAMLDRRPDLAFVYGGYRHVDGDLGPLRDFQPEIHADNYAGLLRRNHIGMHATVFYRRDALVVAGGFDTALRACEDYDVYLRLARTAAFGAYPRIAAGYRLHDANMTRNSALMLRESLAVLARNLPHAGRRPDWIAAHAEGGRFWKDYYGSRLAGDVMAAAVRGSPRALDLLAAGLSCDWRFGRRLLSWRSWLSHLRCARS